MFGLFKKAFPAPLKPSRQNVAFVTVMIPDMLKNGLGLFLLVSNKPEARKSLMQAWDNIGREVPASERLPADGLAIQGMRSGDALCVVMQFPNRGHEGEVAFGVVVARPIDFAAPPADWASVPHRYFGLVLAKGYASVAELTGGEVKPLADLRTQTLDPFVEWVMNCAAREVYEMTVTVPKSDEAMSTAIAQARGTLPKVFQAFLAGELPASEFQLKAPVTDGNVTEHVWLTEISLRDGIITGTIADALVNVTTARQGERHSLRLEEATDWTYVRDGKIHGNYTMRVLLPQLPPAQAAQLQSILAPLPPAAPPPLPSS